LEALRPQLVAAHRTASLRHDEYGQAVTLNLLLRNFVQHHLYDQVWRRILFLKNDTSPPG
jgi:26S proteasome regulatory subunit N3